MVNILDFNVRYLRREHLFPIDTTISLQQIIDSIANYFYIGSNQFLLEINDKRFNVFISLDQSYLDELRSDPYFSVNQLLLAQIRLRHGSSSELQPYINYLTTHMPLDITALSNHVVVWLDLYINYPEDYVTLKNYFDRLISVSYVGLYEFGGDRDIYNVISSSSSFKFDECYNRSILKTFSNSSECLKFIENASALKKTIFVISSSRFGEKLIPHIIDNKYVYSTYILIDGVIPFEEWARPYSDTIQLIPFEHELDLLTRLIRDIATYYEDKSWNDIKSEKKLLYSRWTKKLYMNAITNDQQNGSQKTLQNFEERITKLQNNLLFDDEQISVECTL